MTIFLHLQNCNGWTFTLHTLHPPSSTTTIHHAIDFYTPKIATIVFLMACTKPNRPFENICVLEMPLPKTPNYVVMLKKLKKDLSTPPHPLVTTCKKKKTNFLPNKESILPFTFAITEATMNLRHSILHLRQTNLWTIRKTKKPSFLKAHNKMSALNISRYIFN